ncbi:hypothetical protein [Enterococcus cecorum]|uniref:hypothetical protein n=1 Tax=Enterococcus cecorum TaxID=44008 RepID=UPI001FADBE61|nr:hypothetical protein [Enterococcus cecorum]MCJ0574650.1 hypothetical protein [Enterococcus cecorum]MCJ0575479.1 hypothetical protein [Enterococcus cecorum]
MVYQITKEGTDWQLFWQLEGSLSANEICNLIATTEGFAKWFPELHLMENLEAIRFYSEELYFEEKMKLLTYQPIEKIKYEWANGSVAFEITEKGQQTQLTFSETLPKEFPHRINDMAGWLVKKEHLSDLLNQCEVRADINHTRLVDEVTQIVQNF